MFYCQRITEYEVEYRILWSKYNFWRVEHLYSPINKIKNEMGRNRFYIYSRRLHREVRLYNSLQYDHWVLTESDISVMSYCERPLKINVSIGGKVVETVFDMWIKSESEEKFVFIRYSYEIDLDNKRSSEQAIYEMYAQKIWCAENNKTHCVLTEENIRHNPTIIANKKTLIPFFTPLSEIKPEVYELIYRSALNGPMTIRDLEKSIQSKYHPVIIRNSIFALILHEILTFNQEQDLLCGLTEVQLNVEKTYLR